MTATIKIRKCTHSETSLLLQLASLDGRSIGLNDASLFYRIDPNGFFAAIEENNVVGSISAVSYGTNFGFIGLHFALPQFQNTDVEEKLLEVALQKLNGRTIGLNCYESQLDYYVQHGFEPSHKILTYEGIADGKIFSYENIVSPLLHPLELLLDIDKKYFSYNRKEFLSLWLQQPQSLLLSKMIDGKYLGYGLLSPASDGFKISPLLCEDADTAEQLLCSLIAHLKPDSHFSLDIPDSNLAAIYLAEKLTMKKIKETVRMYSNGKPSISLENVFSFSNYELG